MKLFVKEIIVSDRIRKDLGSIQELADDIKANGLINPIVVNEENVLLAGERRLEAVKLLGWTEVPVTVMQTRDEEHELNIEISENEVRKEFSRAERAECMRRTLEAEKAKAKERQGERTSVRNQTEVQRADTATAKEFGIGKDTLRKELAISDHQDLLEPEDFADWDEGRLSTNKAYQKLEEKLKEAQEETDKVKLELSEERVRGIKTRKQLEDELADLREKSKKQADHQTEYAGNLAFRISELETALAEAKAKEPQVIEKIPEDYEKLKQKNLEQDRELGQMSQKINEERKKVRELTELLGRDELLQDAERDVSAFTNATNSYIRQYGGHVWAFEQLEKISEVTRAEFIKSIKTLDAFAQQMIANLEGGNALNE